MLKRTTKPNETDIKYQAVTNAISNTLALFILGMIYNNRSSTKGYLKKILHSNEESSLEKAINALLIAELIVEKRRRFTTTDLGEECLLKLQLADPRTTRVLIVDDEPNFCLFLTKMLDMRRVKNDIAHTGDEAIELITKNRYQVIFLDIMMPGRNGFEVLKIIRDVSPESKVIMVSALMNTEKINEAYSLGADIFLGKPFSTIDLLGSFDKVLTIHNN